MLRKVVKIAGMEAFVEGETEEELEKDYANALEFAKRYHEDMEEMSEHWEGYEVILKLGKDIDKVMGTAVFDNVEPVKIPEED